MTSEPVTSEPATEPVTVPATAAAVTVPAHLSEPRQDRPRQDRPRQDRFREGRSGRGQGRGRGRGRSGEGQDPGGAGLRHTFVRAATALLAPLAFGVLFLALWQWFVRARDIKAYVLPAPTAIWSAFTGGHARIITAAEHTGLNALVGLLAGTVVAVVVAALAARLRIADELLTPLVAALATMPIVALAPLLNDMYSSTSTLPRRIVVGVSAFVPVFMNVVRGLKRLDPVHAELMASYAASGTAVLRTIRIPGALPYFFTGLRIAASLSVIAAVVTEYFGGLQDGLGARITSAVAATNYPGAWASVLGAVVLGLLFYGVALLAERVAMRGRGDALS